MTPREIRWIIELSEARGWPVSVSESCYQAFGAAIFNTQSPKVKGIHKRVTHALRVWDEKYGPLSPDQEEYAEKVLGRAVSRGAELAEADRGKLYPFVLSFLTKCVNHEVVDRGFKKRSWELDPELLSLLDRGVTKAMPR